MVIELILKASETVDQVRLQLVTVKLGNFDTEVLLNSLADLTRWYCWVDELPETAELRRHDQWDLGPVLFK